MAKPSKDDILKAADELRDLLAEYQQAVGVDEAIGLGDDLVMLAFDIEAVMSGHTID